MPPTASRANDALLRYLASGALALALWSILQRMPFYPAWLGLLLAAGVGAVALFSPGNASLMFVGIVSLPVIAAEFVAGMLFLIGGLVATQYLSMGRATGFLVAAIGVAAVPLHAEWAAVALAGYLLGKGRGAIAATAMGVSMIATGIALGAPLVGTLATGSASPGIMALSSPPADPLMFGWLVPALQAADPTAVAAAVGSVKNPVVVGAQIGLWAVAGALGALVSTSRSPLSRLAGVSAAVTLLGAGHIALQVALDGPVPLSTLLLTFGVSLPLALLGSATEMWVFPIRRMGPRKAHAARERDVDELLRVIASAEDELANRHNTEAVVLITDMKSFSSMTEELGSMGAAKIVQRHRDLLLPIIAKHKGTGAPTGGDGLVACFRSPADAVAAAIEMQRALEGYTGSDRSPHELSVRIGIASGEVVVDGQGVPFLGTALNLAARVMDVADGGRIMITSYVSSAATLDPGQIFRHGDFKLKNIAEAIPVSEVLWREQMTPQEIRAS